MAIVSVNVSLVELDIFGIASWGGAWKAGVSKSASLWPTCGKMELLAFLMVLSFFVFLDFGVLDDLDDLDFGIFCNFTWSFLNDFTFGVFDEFDFFVLVLFFLLFLLFE